MKLSSAFFILIGVLCFFSTVQAQPTITWKTGQTTCYDVWGTEIDCTGTGQDGEVQAGIEWPSPRFEDNGNGTITDHLTGLVWLQNANCFGALQHWLYALDDCNNLSSGTCGLTDGSAAGDWRLPNPKELLSLIDYSQYAPALPTGHPFQNIQISYYWAADTLIANFNRHAWIVNMEYGGSSSDWKYLGNYYVWPVRVRQVGLSGDLNIDSIQFIPNSTIPGNTGTIMIEITNRGDSEQSIFIAPQIIDPTGTETDLEIQSYHFDLDETKEFNYQFTVPFNAEIGQYDVKIQLYRNCIGNCVDPIGNPYLAENAFDVSNDADIIPPASVTDLSAAAGSNRGEIQITWTAPADNGVAGSASGYIVKFATVPINETNWSAVETYVQTWSPENPGTMEIKTLNGFPPGQEFYFAIKSTDEVLNESAVSSSVSALASSAEGANYVDVGIYRIIADNINYLNGSEIEATGNVTLNEVLSFSGLVHINLSTLVITGEGDVFIPDVPLMGNVFLFEDGFELNLGGLITSGLESVSRVAGIDLEVSEMELLWKDLTPDGVKITAEMKFPSYLVSGAVAVDNLLISRTDGLSGAIDLDPNNEGIQINGCQWKLTNGLLSFDSTKGLFKGQGRLVMTKFELEAKISFIDGQLYGVGMCYGFPEPGKVILIVAGVPVVFLQEVCGEAENIPNPRELILRATADITAGPEINNYYLVGLEDSGLEIDISSRATISGTVILGGSYELSYAEAFLDWNDGVFGANGDLNALNIFTASASFNIDSQKNISGRADGNLHVPDEWYYWPLSGKQLANVLGMLDNNGIKGQVQLAGKNWLSAAFGFDWEGNFDVARNIESLDVKMLSAKGLLMLLDSQFLTVNIPAGSEVIYIRIRWTGEGGSSVELIKPDGSSRVTPSDCDADPDVYCESGPKEFWYALNNPVDGQWQVDIINVDNLGDITLEVLSGNGKPFIQLTEPSTDTSTSTTLQIVWHDSDSDDDANISLWYDTDSQGYDGSLIVGGLTENDMTDAYTWNLDTIPTGRYYIYAQIDDGKNTPVRSYAAGMVEVINPAYPTTPANLQANYSDEIVELNWDPVAGCTYTIYYTENIIGGSYENSFSLTEDNHWVVDGSLAGKEIKLAIQAVDSELNSSLISAPIILTVPSRPRIVTGMGMLDFGDESPETLSTKIITIQNSGDTNLDITSLKYVGQDQSAFSVDKSCPIAIAPGAQEQVQLTLHPNKRGNYMATFQIISNDPQKQISEISLSATVNYLCTGDLDADSDVDDVDLAMFSSDFGRTDCVIGEPCGDYSGEDMDLDGSDLAKFASDFGRVDCPIP
jgi:Protein of unknown function (DUF1566)/HYDIN/CFA65/VesB-like, Ig-like domain